MSIVMSVSVCLSVCDIMQQWRVLVSEECYQQPMAVNSLARGEITWLTVVCSGLTRGEQQNW